MHATICNHQQKISTYSTSHNSITVQQAIIKPRSFSNALHFTQNNYQTASQPTCIDLTVSPHCPPSKKRKISISTSSSRNKNQHNNKHSHNQQSHLLPIRTHNSSQQYNPIQTQVPHRPVNICEYWPCVIIQDADGTFQHTTLLIKKKNGKWDSYYKSFRISVDCPFDAELQFGVEIDLRPNQDKLQWTSMSTRAGNWEYPYIRHKQQLSFKVKLKSCWLRQNIQLINTPLHYVDFQVRIRFQKYRIKYKLNRSLKLHFNKY